MRCKTRVPMACWESDKSGALRGGAYRKGEVPCNEEDRVAEVEGAV